MKEVTQVDLHSGTTQLTCWVDRNVDVGNILRLKHDDRLWTVDAVYKTVYVSEINQKWNNNI